MSNIMEVTSGSSRIEAIYSSSGEYGAVFPGLSGLPHSPAVWRVWLLLQDYSIHRLIPYFSCAFYTKQVNRWPLQQRDDRSCAAAPLELTDRPRGFWQSTWALSPPRWRDGKLPLSQLRTGIRCSQRPRTGLTGQIRSLKEKFTRSREEFKRCQSSARKASAET